MKELLQTNRISLSKDYYYWRQYYLAPIFLALGGTAGFVISLSKGKDLTSLLSFSALALTGWVLLYWLDRQLYFKKYQPEDSVDNFRDELYKVLEDEGWKFTYKTKTLAIATKGRELLASRFDKNSYKLCLTGNFTLMGPVFSIIPLHRQGKMVLRRMNVPNSTYISSRKN